MFLFGISAEVPSGWLEWSLRPEAHYLTVCHCQMAELSEGTWIMFEAELPTLQKRSHLMTGYLMSRLLPRLLYHPLLKTLEDQLFVDLVVIAALPFDLIPVYSKDGGV